MPANNDWSVMLILRFYKFLLIIECFYAESACKLKTSLYSVIFWNYYNNTARNKVFVASFIFKYFSFFSTMLLVGFFKLQVYQNTNIVSVNHFFSFKFMINWVIYRITGFWSSHNLLYNFYKRFVLFPLLSRSYGWFIYTGCCFLPTKRSIARYFLQ